MASSYLTPPQLAKLYGIKPDKVLIWIRSGQLRAIDVSERPGGRPRWRIPVEAIEEFERRRSAKPPAPRPVRRRRKQKPAGVIEFFKCLIVAASLSLLLPPTISGANVHLTTSTKPDPLEQVIDFSDLTEDDFNAPPDPEEMAELQAEEERYAAVEDEQYRRELELTRLAEEAEAHRERILQRVQNHQPIWGEDLFEFDGPTDFLLKGLLTRGEFGILAGPYKSCKTRLALEIALSVACGFQPFGHFRCTGLPNQRRVAFFSGELGPATLCRVASRIAEARGVNLTRTVRWDFDVPNLRDPDQHARFADLIKGGSFDLVVLDPLYHALPGLNATNLFAAGKYLRHLARLSREANCTVLACHHTLKPTAERRDPLEIGDVAGAGVAEAVRQWMLVSRRLPFNPLDPQQTHHLWLNYGGSDDFSGVCGVDLSEADDRWSSRVLACEDAIEADAAAKANRGCERQKVATRGKAAAGRKKILDALGESDAPMTSRSIRDATGLNQETLKSRLEELVSADSIEPVKITKAGREYDAYALANEQKRDTE